MSSTPTAPESLKLAIVVHYINAVLAALGGLVYMIIGIAALSEETSVGVIGIVAGLLVMVIGLLLYLKAARGLKRLSNGWRIFSIVIAILALPSIPFGTVLGILSLKSLFNEESKKAFEAAKN